MWLYLKKSVLISRYYDYQLSKARQSLSPGFNVKTTVLSGGTCLVSSGNNISSRASPTMKARQILKRDKRPWPVLVCCFARLLLMTSKADKLPLETEPVARDNNTILTLKLGNQT